MKYVWRKDASSLYCFCFRCCIIHFSPPASFTLIHGSSFHVMCDAHYAIPRGSQILEVVNSRGVYGTGYENCIEQGQVSTTTAWFTSFICLYIIFTWLCFVFFQSEQTEPRVGNLRIFNYVFCNIYIKSAPSLLQLKSVCIQTCHVGSGMMFFFYISIQNLKKWNSN
jgi:hypothetical protein